MKTNLTLVLIAALSGTAAADAYDIEKDFERAAEPAWRFRENPHQKLSGSAETCRTAIAAGDKEGFKPDKKINSYLYKYVPGAVKTERGSPPAYEITWSQAPQVCSLVESALRLQPLTHLLAAAKGMIGDPASPHLKNGAPANSVRWDKQGQECLAAVDAAYAAGVKPTDVILIDSKEITVADARTTACQGLIDWAAAYPGLVEKAKKADLEANIKPWRDAGFKGQRLEAFAERGPDIDGWYVTGCKEPKSRAQLKTAKVAFQWFYPPDGGHMIRKYTFKGDKLVSVTERSYLTEAKAYAGCK